jgi:hypothetical protein
MHTLVASYPGNASFSASVSAAEPHTVSPAATTTTITSDSPDPSTPGQSVLITFSVTSPGGGVPTGSVIVNSSTMQSCAGHAEPDGHRQLLDPAEPCRDAHAGRVLCCNASFSASASAAEPHHRLTGCNHDHDHR